MVRSSFGLENALFSAMGKQDAKIGAYSLASQDQEPSLCAKTEQVDSDCAKTTPHISEP
jgi:hypothetical protein